MRESQTKCNEDVGPFSVVSCNVENPIVLVEKNGLKERYIHEHLVIGAS